jgi:ribosomal protein L16 Arg81 hydroxylase
VHVDAAHVLAVQLKGTKTWEVYRELGDADTVPPAQTVTLSPGDLYYLPPGTPHRAFAGDSGSLHVTFAISEPTLRVLAEAWARRYASSFRRHMWIGGDHQQRLELTRMWLLEMSEALRAADPGQLLAAAEDAWAEPTAEWVEIAEAMDAHRADQE